MPVNAADSAKCEVWHGAFSLTQCQKCCSGKSLQPVAPGHTHMCKWAGTHTLMPGTYIFPWSRGDFSDNWFQYWRSLFTYSKSNGLPWYFLQSPLLIQFAAMSSLPFGAFSWHFTVLQRLSMWKDSSIMKKQLPFECSFNNIITFYFQPFLNRIFENSYFVHI